MLAGLLALDDVIEASSGFLVLVHAVEEPALFALVPVWHLESADTPVPF